MGENLNNGHLTPPAVIPKTRGQLRRIETGRSIDEQNGNASSSANHGNMSSERTPLLPLRGNSHPQLPDFGEPGFWHHFLFNRKTTPGTDHHNPYVKWPTRAWDVTKITLLKSWLNLLLIFVPLGIVAGRLEWSVSWVFWLNFLAIMPLAGVLSFASESIAHHAGQTLGGLVNASFGNAVELIVSIVALRAGEIEIVQASMLGSILSNLLLVLGMCFLLGGIYNMRDGDGNGTEQSFSHGAAQTICSLLAIASASMILPAALYGVLDQADEDGKNNSILILSRGTSIVMLLLYGLYMVFQLRTHPKLFNIEDAEASQAGSTREQQEEEQQQEEIFLDTWPAVLVLAVVTVVISVCADYMVDSIDGLVATANISKTFIGLILIPIVGNAAEHVTACVVAVKNKMDMAVSVAAGSGIQIALMVTPTMVILGWIIGQPMTLHFETFETVAFGLSVIVVTYTVQDGRSNYLEGAMLLGLYAIIALAFWASPADALGKATAAIFGQ